MNVLPFPLFVKFSYNNNQTNPFDRIVYLVTNWKQSKCSFVGLGYIYDMQWYILLSP